MREKTDKGKEDIGGKLRKVEEQDGDKADWRKENKREWRKK